MSTLAREPDNRQTPRPRPQAPGSPARIFRPPFRGTLLALVIQELAAELLAQERAERCAAAPAGVPCHCFAPLGALEGGW